MKTEINWTDFEKIALHVGTIIEVKDFEAAKNPAYQVWIDFGSEIGIKKSSAQITNRYSKEDLLGKQIVAVLNFPKKQIANFQSECLILGAVPSKGDVILLATDFQVPNGTEIA
ncbi:tRNA-binding protein [Flavobacterium tibetense]|jgi:tRNA-binding protein|uniref:tRNA-binding protein n=1 Tax=Flavobacterium tibetense TaxID=2233533 RepID=A0A365NZK0_9FLAO|nr:tRNA-binding protein [Flavobacterium tibetense]RBA27667.1 tRNA-binding protein [Flavobacterium tibetense]